MHVCLGQFMCYYVNYKFATKICIGRPISYGNAQMKVCQTQNGGKQGHIVPVHVFFENIMDILDVNEQS